MDNKRFQSKSLPVLRERLPGSQTLRFCPNVQYGPLCETRRAARIFGAHRAVGERNQWWSSGIPVGPGRARRLSQQRRENCFRTASRASCVGKRSSQCLKKLYLRRVILSLVDLLFFKFLSMILRNHVDDTVTLAIRVRIANGQPAPQGCGTLRGPEHQFQYNKNIAHALHRVFCENGSTRVEETSSWFLTVL